MIATRLARLDPLRALDALHRPREPRCAILGLHGIVDRVDDRDVQLNNVETGAFEALVGYLARTYDVVPLDALLEELACGRVPERAVVLTFDDGYRSTLEIAKPLLDGAGMPYTVFVPTSHIDRRERLQTYVLRTALLYTRRPAVELGGRVLPLADRGQRKTAVEHGRALLKAASQPDVAPLLTTLRSLLSADEWLELDSRFASEELMTWDELRRLAAPVGSHTRDHAILHARQSADEVRAQVTSSKAAVEERLAGTCRHFCYPYGTASDISAAAVAEVGGAGYASGVTSIPGTIRRGVSPLFLPRLPLAGPFERQHEQLERLRRRDRLYARSARARVPDV